MAVPPLPSVVLGMLGVFTKSVWKIIPELEKKMIAHQKWGFEFLWRNIGSLVPEEMEASSCNDYVVGCIIAHTLGDRKISHDYKFAPSSLSLLILDEGHNPRSHNSKQKCINE